ncbi:MAG TPA: hypothetical protein VH370_16620 [Humisphaera sp.]|jgi:hypothetical protein|nr:hypothetical protein [Humisphaera sp.]
MRVGRVKIILPLLALLAILVSTWAHRFDVPPAYRMVDIKALGNFNFDAANGTIDDVPGIFRHLDGQRVMLDGFMWSPMAASQLSDFQFVYNVHPRWPGPPLVQERVFADVPHGKKLPYVDRYRRMYGTLHVNVRREDGVVTSVFRLDVDRAESPRDVSSPPPMTWREYLKNDRNITLDAIAFVLLIVAALYFTASGARRLRREMRARRWRKRGLCPSCGYDLRASTGLCPECGSSERFQQEATRIAARRFD